MAQKLALIRFYFKEQPKPYSDEYFELWTQLEFALIFDGKLTVSEPKKG